MIIATEEVTIADIDEALSHLRDKLEDRYGNRLNWKQRRDLMDIVDGLLDERLLLTGGNREYQNSTAI